MAEVRKLGANDLQIGEGSVTSPAGKSVKELDADCIPVAYGTANDSVTGYSDVAFSVDDALSAVVDVRAYGTIVLNDGTKVTENNAVITAALDACSGPCVVLIPGGTAWSYPTVSASHQNDTIINDQSGWDWYQSNFCGRKALITKTADPGTKNANTFELTAPYHPAMSVNSVAAIGDADINNSTSYLWLRRGDTVWQAMAGLYQPSSVKYQTLSIKDDWAEPDRTVISILGGDESRNEIAFNGTAGEQTNYTFYQRLPDGGNGETMVTSYYSTAGADAAAGAIYFIYSIGAAEKWRLKILTDNTLAFEARTGDARTFILHPDGRIQTSYNSFTWGTIPTTGTWAVGDIVYSQGTDNVLGWKCTVAGTPGTWKSMTITLEA